jgi:hypothetical protein
MSFWPLIFFFKYIYIYKRNRGWLQPPLWPKWGGRTTPFLAKGWLVLRVVEPPPWPKGVVQPPPKGQKKKEKEEWVLVFWGWLDHLQRPGVASLTHIPAVGGGRSHPKPLGVERPTSKDQNLFFFFLAFSHPLSHRGGSTTPKLAMGPLAKNGAVRPPHLGHRGGSKFLLLFFFF